MKIKSIQILVILALVFSAIRPASTSQVASASLRIQPLVAEIAGKNPEQLVDVIVQKQAFGSELEALVERLGGQVTLDLRIINAFAARMAAGAARTLAADPAVRWISLDAKVESTVCTQCIDTANLVNAYDKAIKADLLWNASPYLQGDGIGVAIVDSGVNPNQDLTYYKGTRNGQNRIMAAVHFNTDYNQTPFDGYGHGTHVASIVGGTGGASNGQYIGVAPMVNLVNVKVSNDDGSASIHDVVNGLQWVLEHKSDNNIRVVNLSLNSATAESYNTSPLDAAVEILWFNGIVVVVSAGNNGSGAIYPPANDPFVITVGATDDKGTASISDDVIASFSAYGPTDSGVSKPDLVAPGKNIVARIINLNMGLAAAHPANIVGTQYFRMSGTSMAAPMVSGVVALLLQDEPGLTPDQVKYRLKATANKSWAGYSASKAGAGYLDAEAAVHGTTTQSANTRIVASNLLTTGSTPITWNSVGWNSVGWNSVGWNSVGWNSVGWNSVGWNSDYWGQ